VRARRKGETGAQPRLLKERRREREPMGERMRGEERFEGFCLFFLSSSTHIHIYFILFIKTSNCLFLY
jgi:hypothetical protein